MMEMWQRAADEPDEIGLHVLQLHHAEPPQPCVPLERRDDRLKVARQQRARFEADIFERADLILSEGLNVSVAT